MIKRKENKKTKEKSKKKTNLSILQMITFENIGRFLMNYISKPKIHYIVTYNIITSFFFWIFLNVCIRRYCLITCIYISFLYVMKIHVSLNNTFIYYEM